MSLTRVSPKQNASSARLLHQGRKLLVKNDPLTLSYHNSDWRYSFFCMMPISNQVAWLEIRAVKSKFECKYWRASRVTLQSTRSIPVCIMKDAWVSFGKSPGQLPPNAVWIICIFIPPVCVKISSKKQVVQSPGQHRADALSSQWNAAVNWPSRAVLASPQNATVLPPCGYSNSE